MDTGLQQFSKLSSTAAQMRMNACDICSYLGVLGYMCGTKAGRDTVKNSVSFELLEQVIHQGANALNKQVGENSETVN